MRRWLALLVALAACGHRPVTPSSPAASTVVVSMVATTDLHGHVESLPWLAGHLANLRARRAHDGGGVLLVDGGDMFQGTLESNLGEGAAVVRAYNALRYDAVTIGNHEFDFGPVGPAHLPGPGDDPRGALKQRAAEARYPFLAANLRERGAATTVAWPNVHPWTLVDVAGVRVGVVGVATSGTPRATHPRTFAGLEILPLAESIATAARAARAAGALVVVVAAHAGGQCTRFDDPADLTACDPGEEIFAVARALPPGLVDAIAAGHTHQAVAHRVAGIAVVQAYSAGRAFARVDFTVDRRAGRVVAVRIFPPRPLCDGGGQLSKIRSFAADACHPEPYEGAPVRFDPAIAAVMAPDVARAAALRAQPLGVVVAAPIRRAEKVPSALGNLAADLMRAAKPGADVAFINGGSLRSDLPPGPLQYGALYEAFPFDDRLATLRMSARQLAGVVIRNLSRGLGILSLSGVRAVARCQQGRLAVTLYRDDGREIPPETPLTVVTNGYLASGGDGLLDGIDRDDADDTADEVHARPFRDDIAALLASRGGRLQPSAGPPRLEYPGVRPVQCPPSRGVSPSP